MKNELKLTIEYDGLKVEKTFPVGNIYKAMQGPAYFGIAPEDECAYIMHDHILYNLMEQSEHARYYGHEQGIPHFKKLREMCRDLFIAAKAKLKTL